MASSSRTVRVKFDGDTSGLDRSSKLGARALSTWRDGLAKVDSAFSRTSKTSGDSVTKVNQSLVKVDSQLKATRDRLDGVVKSFAETGDITLLPKVSRDTGLLRKLESVRKEILRVLPDEDDGHETGIKFGARFAEGAARSLARAGGPVAAGLSAIFGDLPPQAQLAIGATVVAGVASVAPFIGATVAGAVVGGVGLGGVAGGLAIAAKHPAVQAAAKQTGAAFTAEMQRAGMSFVPVTKTALGLVRNEISDLGDDAQRILGKASKWVEPLTRSALGFVRNLMPGIEAAVDRAGPIIGELASWGPRLGKLLSDMLTDFSKHTGDAARALELLWLIFSAGIKMLSDGIGILTATYGWMEKIGALLNHNVAQYAAIKVQEDQAAKGSGDFGQSLAELTSQFGSFGTSADAAVTPLETFAQSLERIRQENFDARSASRDFQAAIDDATASLKTNGKTLDETTPKGRANAEALDRIASSANAAYTAILTQTGSQEQANAVLTTGRARFIALATSMGMSSTAAKRLADMLFAIPSPKTKITVENQQALNSIRAVQQSLGKLKDIHRGVYYTSHGDLKVPGGTLTKNAAGGYVRGPGTATSDSILARLSDGEYVIRAAAVRQLGVGFLNQLNSAGGGTARTMLADRDYLAAARRTSAPAAPSGAGAATSGPVVLENHIHVGDEVVRVVRTEISSSNRDLERRVLTGSRR